MLKAASLVTDVLLLSVPLRRFPMLLPVPLLIVVMLLLPFLLAIAHHLAILRICRQLPATRIGAPPALAIQLTANSLITEGSTPVLVSLEKGRRISLGQRRMVTSRKRRRRSPTGSNGRPWKNWRLSRNRIRCWPGAESSSPTSLTDRSFANPRVVLELTRKPSGWWCGWRRKIPGGAMTGSWAPWPT